MNRRQRDYVECLERRRNELARRLMNWRRGNKSRTELELASLNFAIRVIRNAEEEGTLRELSS